MNDETQAGPGPGTAVAVRPPRAIAVVEDVVPIFDTNDFEHMQRIATAMANAPLVPKALKGGSLAESAANCLMVVNQARNWKMDPFSVAQCCFVTSGKLGYEGKLVAAVIKSRLGHDLHYWFTGTKGNDDYRVYVSDQPFTEEIVAELAPGKSYLRWRIIDGSVGEWKTTNDNWKKQPDMQLRYRGGRVWCRAYEPAVLLGVYADDELEEIAERRERFGSGETAARAVTSGFGDETDQTFRRPQGGPRTGAGAEGSSGAGESGEGPSASAGAAGGGKSVEGAGDGAAETVQDAEFEDVGGDKAVGAGAQEGAGGGGSEEARQEPVAGSEVSQSGGVHQGEGGGDPGVIQGPAPAGEAYFFAGDAEISEAGRRRTYKDGLEFSAVKADNKNHKTYSEHAPRPTETGGAPSAAEQQASSGSATGASTASAAATPGPSESSERSSAGAEEREPPGETTTGTSKSPPSSAASPGPGDPFEVCREEILRAGGWLGIKQHLRTLAKTDQWKGAEDEAKRMAQAEAWDRYREIRNEGAEVTNPVDDLSLFALWLQFEAQTAEEVENLFATFMRKPAYKDAKDADKGWVRDAVNRQLDKIRGGQ